MIIDRDISDTELKILYKYDPNLFNRYDAGQTFLKRMMKNHFQNKATDWDELGDILIEHLENSQLDPAYRSVLVGIPSLTALTQGESEIDYHALNHQRSDFLWSLMKVIAPRLKALYHSLSDSSGLSSKPNKSSEYDRSQEAINKRKLKNTCLSYLFYAGGFEELFWEQFKKSNNMTDTMSAISLLAHTDSNYRSLALKDFLDAWSKDLLVINKWFLVQALSKREDTLKAVKKLEFHPQFDNLNPNKIRSLFASFTHNLPHFHHPSGQGYEYISDKVIEIDAFNPMAASSLVNAFSQMQKMIAPLKDKMKKALIKITKSPNLSANVFEIVEKMLKQDL